MRRPRLRGQRPATEGTPHMTSITTRLAGARANAATEEPQTSQETRATGAGSWRPTPRSLWTLAVLLLVAAAVVIGTLGRAAWQRDQVGSARAEALAAGRQLAVNFVTVSSTTFDADTARVVAGATGEFKKEYEGTLAQLKPVVVENKTVSTVERAEASLVSGDLDSAQVIVGVVAPTTNTATKTPEKKTYRLRLDLVKDGATWKVSSLDFVS